MAQSGQAGRIDRGDGRGAIVKKLKAAYIDYAKTPDGVILDDGEVWRIKRARVALLLHVMPEAVDDMPGEDVEDVLAIHAAEAEIEAWHHQKQSKRMNLWR